MAVSEQVITTTPTKIRYGVLAFACALSMITYLDRVCFAQAKTSIVEALHLNSVADLKWAFTAFAFAYAAFEVPSGWLGDVFGPRSTLIRIVLWWSAFTALTGVVGWSLGGISLGLGYLIAVRFLFGIGEAGAYPNITRALHNWFPFRDRGFTQGMVWMSGRLMGGLTPIIWGGLVAGIGTWTPLMELLPTGLDKQDAWRGAFWFFGLLGIVWCVLFALWFQNRPDEKATVNAAERDLIEAGRTDQGDAHAGVPWRKLFTSGNLWALCLMYFCSAYGWYFNITYLPSYLQDHGVSDQSLLGNIYKGGPLLLGAVGCLSGGLFTDWFIRRTGNQRLGRRLLGIIGHLLCASCYFACLGTNSAFSFALAISLAAFFNDLTMGSAWATCQDIGGRYAAIVAGCMNTIGNLGGAAAGVVTGMILDYTLGRHAQELNLPVKDLSAAEKVVGLASGYDINFISFGVVYLLAVLCWLRIDASKPVAPDHR
jgi:ACS family glucarate transporter-like MFS transporter